MANELDEVSGPVNSEGRDVNVISKQIKVEVGTGSKIFEVSLWVVGPTIGLLILLTGLLPTVEAIALTVLGMLPGLIFIFMKVNSLAYLRKLQQKIQADASQIDNYLEQRVVILQNVVGLVEKSIDLDKDVMKAVAAYRGGQSPSSDLQRNEASQHLDGLFSRINVAFESILLKNSRLFSLIAAAEVPFLCRFHQEVGNFWGRVVSFRLYAGISSASCATGASHFAIRLKF